MGYGEKRGDYWRARYKIAPGKYRTLADGNGELLRFRTKRAAEQAANEEEAKVRGGRWHDPAAARITFGEYANRWYARQDLAASTMQNYRRHIENHLLPAFEDTVLLALTSEEVDLWEKRERAAGYAASSIKTWRSTLHLILSDAEAEERITSNPATKRRGRGRRAGRSRNRGPQKVVTDTLGLLLIAERAALLSGRDDEFVAIVTKGMTGMRFGELAGLRRAHVHLDRALIHIAADSGALHEVAGDRWLGSPKTKAAVRDVRLPAFLVGGLDRCLGVHPYETVFCTEAGRWLWRTTFIERMWRPACDGHPARGWNPILPSFRFHDLRHTHRTWMEEDGIAEPLKSQRLGHQLPGIRGVYAHVTEPMQPPLLARLQDRWLGSGGYW